MVASLVSLKHFHEGTAEPQISPLRFAPVEMTKERAVLPETVVAEQEPPRVDGESTVSIEDNC
jgi:hypothetical protein